MPHRFDCDADASFPIPSAVAMVLNGPPSFTLQPIDFDERVRYVRRFEQNPAKTIGDAANGSIIDFNAVYYSIHASRIPQHLIAATATMLCSFLTEDPSDLHGLLGDSGHFRLQDRAFLCTVLVPFLLEKLAGPLPAAQQPLALVLMRHWIRIVDWMRFVKVHAIDRKALSNWPPISAGRILVHFLRRVLNYTDLETHARRDQRISELISQLWLHNDDIDGVDTMMLQQLSYFKKFRNLPALLRTVMREAGGNLEHVAHTLVRRLNAQLTAFSLSPKSLDGIHETASLVVGFSKYHEMNSLRAPLLLNGAVRAVTSAIRTVGHATPQVLLAASAHGRMESFFLFLCETLCAPIECSHQLVMDAAHSELLDALVACASNPQLTADATSKNARQLVAEVLPQSLVYQSVILAFANALSNLPRDALEHLRNGPFEEEWAIFEHLLWERAVSVFVFRYFDSSHHPTCITCGKSGAKSKFPTCSGCNVALYCSAECHGLDAFKTLSSSKNGCGCNELPEELHTNGSPTAEDVRFKTWLEEREVLRHMVGLERRLQDATNGGKIRDAEFCYVVNVELFPPVLGVFGIRTIRPPGYRAVPTNLGANSDLPRFPEHSDERGIVRSVGRDSRNKSNQLETSWDDVDEILYRLNISKIGCPGDWNGKTLQRFACGLRGAVRSVMIDKSEAH